MRALTLAASAAVAAASVVVTAGAVIVAARERALERVASEYDRCGCIACRGLRGSPLTVLAVPPETFAAMQGPCPDAAPGLRAMVDTQATARAAALRAISPDGEW